MNDQIIRNIADKILAIEKLTISQRKDTDPTRVRADATIVENMTAYLDEQLNKENRNEN